MFIQGLQESVRLTFVNWRNFSGRVSRKGYWLPVLALTLFSSSIHLAQAFVLPPTFPVLLIMAPLFAASVPFYSLAARRLHDVNRSGWWVISPLLPYLPMTLIGVFPVFFSNLLAQATVLIITTVMSLVGAGIAIYFLYLLCKKGDEGVNEYGSPQPFNQS